MRNCKLSISVDGIQIYVTPNTTVLQACEALGIEIPRFCFHERLNVAGNCRICLVEITKSPKPQASCALPVSNGIEVYTNSPLVKKARESVLEIMLKNHPLDCPICDQGGECDLQDEAWGFGSSWSRFTAIKRSVNDKSLGPLIKTVINRCIHCTRCVRFSNEIAGVSLLGTSSRGESTEITTYVDQLLESELSGNIIDLCPVGALTSKPYAFTARPWELNSVQSLDLTDALGSNTRLDFRGSNLLRILPRLNEEINEEWLTDKGRFHHDGLDNQRLLHPIVKINSILKPLSFINVWKQIKLLLIESKFQKQPLGFFPGKLVDLETLVIIQNIVDRISNSFLDTKDCTAQVNLITDFGFNQSFSSLEQSDYCLLIGTNPRTEGSLINTRLRKGYLSGKITITSFGPQIDLGFPINQLGTSLTSLIQFFEGKHLLSKSFLNAKQPRIILGNSFFKLSNSIQIIQFLKQYQSKLNFLHVEANQVSQSILGFNSATQSEAFLGIAIEQEDLNNFNVKNWIYMGSHINDEILKHPNLRLCLPVASFVEKTSTFFNLQKKDQKINKAIDLNLLSTRDWLTQIQCMLSNSQIKLNSKCYKNYLNVTIGPRILNHFELETTSLYKVPCDILDEERILFQPNIVCQNSVTLASCAKQKSWLNFGCLSN